MFKKENNKLVSLILLMLSFMILFVGCSNKPSTQNNGGSQTSDKTVKIKFGATNQANMAPGLADVWLTGEINSKSNGKINVSYHGQSTIGNDADLMQQVMTGNIQIAGVAISAFSQYTPLLESVQLPFLLGSYEEEEQALKSNEIKAIIASIEKKFNVKILGFTENGMRHFATINKPINTINDLKGVKLRVPPSVIIQKAMGLLGANPMSIAYGEVSTALQNRTIDGEEINITSAGSQKHYEVIKYISEVGFYPYPSVYVMNGDFYNSLSDENKKIIVDTFAAAQDKAFKELIVESEKKLRKECEDNGVKFNKIENLQPFKDAVKSLYTEYSAKDPLIKSFIEKYNK